MNAIRRWLRRRYQFVWMPVERCSECERPFPRWRTLAFRRLRATETDMGLIYDWAVALGPLQIRRCHDLTLAEVDRRLKQSHDLVRFEEIDRRLKQSAEDQR